MSDWPNKPNTGRLGVDYPAFSGINYPFILKCSASQFIEDLYVVSELDPVIELHLLSISGLGFDAPDLDVPPKVNAVDLEFSDRDFNVLLDTRSFNFIEVEWVTGVFIYTWQSNDSLIKAVVNKNISNLKSAYKFSNGLIDDRAIYFKEPSVSEFLILDSYSKQWESIIGGDKLIRISEGFNSNISTQIINSDRGDKVNLIELSATPGTGLGRVPACDVNKGITRLGGVLPNASGDFLLSGQDCIVVKPVVSFSEDGAEIVPGEFKIEDLCEPPCDCDDFSSVAFYVIRVWNKFLILADRVNDIRDEYHEIRAAFIAMRSCANSNPVRVYSWKAQPCGVGIGISVCNISDECIDDGEITIDVDTIDSSGDGAIDKKNVYRSRRIGRTLINERSPYEKSGNSYTIKLNPLAPGDTAFVFIRYDFAEGDCNSIGLVNVSLSGVSGSIWNGRLNASSIYDFSNLPNFEIPIGGGGGSEPTYFNDTPVPIGIGGIAVGQNFDPAVNFSTLIERLFYPEMFPTLTPPSQTFVIASHQTLMEIGQTLNVVLNMTFNRGTIVPQYTAASGFRSGLPNRYQYQRNSADIHNNETSSLTNSYTDSNYVIQPGNQVWRGRVHYDEGPQPKSSYDNNFESPLPASALSYTSRTITGVYPFFATQTDITILTKQPLVNYGASGFQFFEVSLVAEQGSDKQKVEIPDAAPTITGIQFLNTINNQWEWLNGNKAASLTAFDGTPVVRQIHGNDIDYILFEHTNVTVGARSLRFYVT